MSKLCLFLVFCMLAASSSLFAGLKGRASTGGRLTKITTLKDEICAEAKGTANGVKASPEKRQKIQSLVNELEKLNGEKRLSNSPKLDGNWDLLFTTNDGSSAGKIGPFTGAVRQDITLEDQAYINYVSLGPVLAFLGATWENLGNNKWKVIFVDISLKVLGVQLLNKKFPENTTGIWRMSYLDDDFRVLYAAGGKVDTKTKNKDGKTENIYILQKKN